MRSLRSPTGLWALLWSGVMACSSSPPPLVVADGCQPLFAGSSSECLLPYPSDFYLVADPAMPSGHRVEMRGAARMILPETKVSADPNDLRAVDGFSPLSTIVAVLPSPIVPVNLTPLANAPGDTTSIRAATLIIDAESGMLIPHFVDIDGEPDGSRVQGLVLHPLAPLLPRHRYVVALNGVFTLDGQLASTPEGFRRLRDQEPGDAIEPLREAYERDVFPPIVALGVKRAALQLAWTFTTGSTEHITRDMFDVRRLTLAWLATHTPTVLVGSVVEHGQSLTWRRIEGDLEVPLFVDSTGPGAKLARDADGAVEQRGTTRIPFTMMVPRAVEDSGEPGPILCFGHGFFGGQVEITEPQTREIAQRTGTVLLSIDWQGMSRQDVFLVVEGLVSHPYDALSFVERTHQAMANWIVVTHALRTAMHDLPAMRAPGGRLVYDDTTLSFLGISEGHILGGTLAGVHPEIQRITLNAGGAGFSLLMSRARPFAPFLVFLDESLPDKLDQLKFVALSQTQLDRIDPATYAPFVVTQPLEGAKPKKILLQIGLGDVQVPNLGAWLHARALGIPLLTPSPAQVAGVPEIEGPVDGSAMTLFDFGIDLSVYARAAAPELGNQVHDRLRLTDPVVRQLASFVKDGTIIQPCDGQPCRVE